MGKIAACVSFLIVSFGIATADEFLASISKVDGKKITAKVVKIDKDAAKGKGGFGGGFGKGGKDAFKDAESKTLTITADCKVMKRGKFDLETKKVGESTALEDGIKNKMFTEATDEKPVTARITTNTAGEITEISVGGGGGFGGGKGKKKKDTN